MRKANIDADPDNADWTKRTWDLPEDPTQAAAILALGFYHIEDVMNLPVMRWHPEKAAAVRPELERIMAENARGRGE